MKSIALLVFAAVAHAAGGSEFVGTWKLGPVLQGVSPAPADTLRIVESGGKLQCTGCGPGEWVFAVDGKDHANTAGGVKASIAAKWEGSALLVNAILSGGANAVVMDRWKLSRGGVRLMVTRQIARAGGEVEGTFVFDKEGAGAAEPKSEAAPVEVSAAPKPSPAAAPKAAEKPKPTSFEIASGTRIPLRMMSTVTTKSANEGDRVYLETAYPISDGGRVVIPVGSQVSATVRFAKPAGKVKGRGELFLAFDTLTLPNGVSRDVSGRIANAEPGTGDIDSEGKVKGPGDKGGDARKVGEAAGTGAAVGSIAGAASGRYGTGVAIGAAAGAAAGLGRVLSGRGPQVEMPRGSSVEMVLTRPLKYAAEELPAR